MFLRKLKNRSGSISVQIISKSGGKYKVIKTIGSSKSEQEIEKLYFIGKQELERISTQPKLFVSENFTAYCIYKELERILYNKEKSTLSLKNAAEITHNMYEISYTLPESKHTKTKLLKMDEKQAHLYQIIQKNY